VQLEVTPDQEEIAVLVSNGYTAQEIADTLQISRRTVETQKKHLNEKLHTRNERELIRVAGYLGMVDKDALNFYSGTYKLPLGKSKEQRAMNREQRTKSKEKRENWFEGKEQRTNNR
jgi:DNA-binding CsgD family transcriptional regulator